MGFLPLPFPSGVSSDAVCAFSPLTKMQSFTAFHAWQRRGCLKECSGVGGRDRLLLLQRSLEDKKGEGITYLADCRGKTRGIALIF